MTVSNNLQMRSNGVYYLRVFIPSALVKRFGRKEITRSLGTKCRRQAERLAISMRAKAYGLMDMATKNPHLTKEDLRQIAKRYFDRAMADEEVNYLDTKYRSMDREMWVTQYEEMIEELDYCLGGHLFESGTVTEIMNKVLEHEGLDLAPDSHEYRQVAEIALRTAIEVNRMQQSRLIGNFKPEPSEEILTSSPTKATKSDGEAIAFDDLVAKFITENEQSWKPKTLEKYRANLPICSEILGKKVQASTIHKAAVRKVKETLGALPPNWTKLHPSISVEEVVEITKGTDEDVLSPSTANSYLTSLSSLMAWAGKQGYVGSNPVSGMLFPDPVKNKDKRDPFLAKDLDSIFSAPIFTGMKSEHHWKKPGSVIDRGERFWIPLIALFSGMRLGEIVNLNVDDFKAEDGIDCLIIRESKTEAGVRRVPLHPELKEIGLLGFVKGIQQGQPLFAGTSSDAYSKHFGRLLDSVGITDRKLVFHSFRHTFTDALRAAKVTEPIAKALIGHSDGTVTGQYGSGYPMDVLYDELKRVRFPELVLTQHYQSDGK